MLLIRHAMKISMGWNACLKNAAEIRMYCTSVLETLTAPKIVGYNPIKIVFVILDSDSRKKRNAAYGLVGLSVCAKTNRYNLQN